MQTVMRKAFTLAVTVWPATPDGFAEVHVEVNGRTVATDVFAPGDDGGRVLSGLVDEVWKRC